MFQTEVIDRIKTRTSRLLIFFLSENSSVHEIMWKNIWQTTDDNKTRRMRIVCRINKITNIHSCHTYSFSTSTMVTRMSLSVTFIRTLPLLFWGRLSVRYEGPQINFGHNLFVRLLQILIKMQQNDMFIEICWDVIKQLNTKNNKRDLRYQVHLFCCTRLYLTQ
jgi:hypothetical protein